ncbi:MAG: hypothetical protein ACYDA0_14555 [Candidatus Dormibacteraceae bacterium]
MAGGLVGRPDYVVGRTKARLTDLEPDQTILSFRRIEDFSNS